MVKRFFIWLANQWQKETPKIWKFIGVFLYALSALCLGYWAAPDHYPKFIDPYIKILSISIPLTAFATHFTSVSEKTTEK